MQTLAQADDAAEAVDHAKPVALGRRSDQQPAVVGSEIQSSKGRRENAARRLHNWIVESNPFEWFQPPQKLTLSFVAASARDLA